MKNLILLTCLAGLLVGSGQVQAQETPATNTPAATGEIKDSANPDPSPADSTPQPPSTSDNTAAPATPTAPSAPIVPPPSTRAHPAPVTDAVDVTGTPGQHKTLTTNADGSWSLNISTNGNTSNPPSLNSSNGVSLTVPAADNTSLLIPGTNKKGLRMNFRGAPLETVLNYMSDAAGFIIHPRVPVTGKVDVWSATPLSNEEAVKLLQQVLNENGYTAMREGRTLTIIKSDEAARSTIPVRSSNDPQSIPNNAEVVTQIIPVRTLNVVQLAKDLEPLRPSGAVLTADESANSLVMTDTQSNIRHITEIVKALDSVTSSSAMVRVFPLKYADSKALASLVKDLFPSTDSASRSGGAATPGAFPGFFGGGRGERGGRGGGEGGGSESGNGHTPTAKVNAVSDDHSNSLVVSAPDEVMPTIEQLVKQVDTAVEEETSVKLFHLKNADATEMADLITSLFPDDSSSSDATRGRFGFFFPGSPQPSTANSSSDRMKKMSHVGVAADRRTSTLVVTAGKDLMPQISTMIDELDQRPDRKMTMHVIHLQNADPVDIQAILQELITSNSGSSSSRSGGSSGSSSSSTGNNYLQNRATTLLQQQNSTQGSSSGTGGLGGASTSSRGL